MEKPAYHTNLLIGAIVFEGNVESSRSMGNGEQMKTQLDTFPEFIPHLFPLFPPKVDLFV